MKRIWILMILVLSVAGCRIEKQQEQLPDTTFPAPLIDVSESAALAIVVKGTQLDLSKNVYVNQSSLAFLDSKFPGIIRIKKSPLTWQDFFDEHVISIEDDCLTVDTRSIYCTDQDNTLKIFYNGKPTQNLLSQPLTQDDTVLISFGDEQGAQLQRQLSLIPEIK